MFNYKIIVRAFSLIELMIVIAIIGVLATIGVPAYEGYTIRAKVTEGLNILQQLKQMSVDYYNQNAMLPGTAGGGDNGLTDLNTNSLAYTTSNVASVNITSNGVLQVIFTSVIPSTSGNATLNLVPTTPTIISGGSGASGGTTSIITWQCGSASILQTYLPGTCIYSTSIFPN